MIAGFQAEASQQLCHLVGTVLELAVGEARTAAGHDEGGLVGLGSGVDVGMHGAGFGGGSPGQRARISDRTGRRWVRNPCGSSLMGKWPMPGMITALAPAMLRSSARVSSGLQE